MANSDNEIIFDLTREIKQMRERKAISNTFLGIKIDPAKDNLEKVAGKICKKVINPMVAEDLPVNELIHAVENAVSNDENIIVIIEPLEVSSYEYRVVTAVAYERNYRSKRVPMRDVEAGIPVKVTVGDQDFKQSVYSLLKLPLPERLSKGGRKWRIRSGDYIVVSDLGLIISKALIANELYRYIKNDAEMHQYILLREATLTADPSYNWANKDEDSPEKLLEVINKCLEAHNLPLVEALGNIYSPRLQWIKDFVNGINPLSMMKVYSSHQQKDVAREFTFSSFNYDFPAFAMVFIKNMVKEDEQIKDEAKRRLDIASDYALSWQMKKNIPQKILAKMKSNRFLKWFGEVEFDESTDLDKLSVVEKQFEDFAEYMNLPISKDHSIRFRKLGHHKASGLYYPGAKAVCIDVRTADSAVHEIGHKIDFTSLKNDTLSSLYNFRSVVDCYCRITDGIFSKLDNKDPMRLRWDGKTKYNKKYYQLPAEIFARCFEIYVQKILGFTNSLVNITDTDEKYFYPNDPKFYLMIEKYFKSLFGEVGVYKKEEAQVASSGGVRTSLVVAERTEVAVAYRKETDGQLVLF